MPISRTNVTPAKPAVSATAAPVTASTSRKPSPGTRNCCISASSRNHSETNPAVGGSPARVRPPMARPVPRHGASRATPRSASRLSVPAADSMPAAAVNSSDLAAVCAITCRVAASSPAATRSRSPTAAPTRATPKPARISPAFSTLEYAMTRSSPFCTAACAIPSTAVSPASTSSVPVTQPGGGPSTASVRHIP